MKVATLANIQNKISDLNWTELLSNNLIISKVLKFYVL